MTDDSSRGIQASDPVSLSCAGSDTAGMCFANNARNIPLLNVDFTASNASPCALLLPYGGSDIVTEDPDALHTRPRVSVPSHGRSVSLHLPHEFLCSSPPSSPQKSARLHVFDSFVAPLPQTPTRSQSPVIGGSLGQLHRRSPSTASTSSSNSSHLQLGGPIRSPTWKDRVNKPSLRLPASPSSHSWRTSGAKMVASSPNMKALRQRLENQSPNGGGGGVSKSWDYALHGLTSATPGPLVTPGDHQLSVGPAGGGGEASAHHRRLSSSVSSLSSLLSVASDAGTSRADNHEHRTVSRAIDMTTTGGRSRNLVPYACASNIDALLDDKDVGDAANGHHPEWDSNGDNHDGSLAMGTSSPFFPNKDPSTKQSTPPNLRALTSSTPSRAYSYPFSPSQNSSNSSTFAASNRESYDRFIPNRAAMIDQVTEMKRVVTNENVPIASLLSPASSANCSSSSSSSSSSSASMLSSAPPSASNNAANVFTSGSTGLTGSSPVVKEFHSYVAHSFFEGQSLNESILAFKRKHPKTGCDHGGSHSSKLQCIFSDNKFNSNGRRTSRMITATPERILDAPELVDDFYLNLLDWSSSNILAVGLGSCLYLWNALSGDIDLLLENKENDNYVTSVRWMEDGQHVAVGMSDHNLLLWNVEKKKQVRSLNGHMARISSLAWNKNILSSGGRDSLIINHDVRAADARVATLNAHDEEICGMAWSYDGMQLASGGNDNMCCLWDKANTAVPRYMFRQHNAAVKALAWCPFQKELLATGGGTADRHIRFFNCSTGAMVSAIDTKSQVCSLAWSKTEKEILSAHGFSQNQLTVWKYPTMTPLANLTGHTSRVLHTATSPDGSTVCSAAADETIRFWHVWDNFRDKKAGDGSADLVSRGAMGVKIR